MKNSILAVLLTFGLVATVQATDFSDVGPASLFWDYNGSDVNEMDHSTASGMNIVKDKGIVYVKDGMKRDEMLDNDHTDIIPSALLY